MTTPLAAALTALAGLAWASTTGMPLLAVAAAVVVAYIQAHRDTRTN